MAIVGTIKGGPPPSVSVEEWPDRPVYVCAHDTSTRIVETESEKTTAANNSNPLPPLPLGKVVRFESDLFADGKFVLQLQTHPESANGYFEGRKRTYRAIFQGRFQEQILLSDLKIGDSYDKPLENVQKGTLMKLYEKFMETISPGLIMDLTSDRPKLLAAFGSAQTMRVDMRGNEPDLVSSLGNDCIEEDTTLLFGRSKFDNAKSRRRYLSKPKNAAKYRTNLDHVYTIELYDSSVDFGVYKQNIMGGVQFDMCPNMNGQPLALAVMRKKPTKPSELEDEGVEAVTKGKAATTEYEFVFKFPIWHERLLEYKASE